VGNITNSKNPAARERLAHIERLAYWRGWVRRSDLCGRFKISVPQASADLTAYQQINPKALIYDRSGRCYRASQTMRCKLKQPSFGDALVLLDPITSNTDQVARIDLPHRSVPALAARDIMRGILSGGSVRIHYYSIHSATARWRWITPHALAHDGYRWHVRAWDVEDQEYKDFVLGRISQTEPPVDKGQPPRSDKDWSTWATIRFRPNRQLSQMQCKAIEHDYAMKDGVATLRVRKAMLHYTLVYLNLADMAKHLELVGKPPII